MHKQNQHIDVMFLQKDRCDSFGLKDALKSQ